MRPLPLLGCTVLLAWTGAACGHGHGSTASQASVTQPSSPKDPYDPGGSGWRTPGAAYVGERNRCIDRELARRDLNEFGDPQGTTYPEGRPLGVAAGVDRYEYVLRNYPAIRTMCSAVPGEPVR